jgi:hypothetical protein
MTLNDFCSNCGREQAADNSFCPGCGRANSIHAGPSTPNLIATEPRQASPIGLGDDQHPSAEEPELDGWWARRKRRTKFAIAGGAIVAVLIASAALAAPQPDETALASPMATPSTTQVPTAMPTVAPTALPTSTSSPKPTPRPTPRPTPVPKQTWDQMMAAAKNVSYDALFRHSARHVGDDVYFQGEVIQVLGERGYFEMRISVTPGDYGFWDDPIYVTYTGTKRFLVDDIVEFIGLSTDLYTYESVMGGDITIPSVMTSHMRLIR